MKTYHLRAFLLMVFMSLCMRGNSVLTLAQSRGPESSTQFNIPYEKFVLANGLTLIVHEDHKAPIVAVNIWYHVGSKNEKPGKTGLAHLFEHLMFNGSEHTLLMTTIRKWSAWAQAS